MNRIIALLLVAVTPHLVSAKEFHVSVNGNDQDKGSASKPFRTISAAAQVAQHGQGHEMARPQGQRREHRFGALADPACEVVNQRTGVVGGLVDHRQESHTASIPARIIYRCDIND